MLIMFCYLFFYTGRQNFGFAALGMQRELALSATALGLFNAALLAGYGLGQSINGNLGDLHGARRMVAIGAFVSVALNWAVSLATSFPVALVCWGVNGYAQSSAWPSMSRVLADWWPRKERGKAMGFYLLASGFSSTLTFLLCILVIQVFDWRWVFRLPVLTLVGAAAAYSILSRNRPQDDGFPPLPADPSDAPGPAIRESSIERYKRVLLNRPFQLACMSIGCENLARYGLLNWAPVHLLGTNWRQGAGAAWITLALPLGMALGSLAAGLAADRWFPTRRARLVVLCLALAAVSALLLAAVPIHSPAAVVLLAVTGFLVYAPQASYWALCPALAGSERTGTASGLMDASAYAFAAAGEIGIGFAIDATGTTASAFVVVAAACVLGTIPMLFLKD